MPLPANGTLKCSDRFAPKGKSFGIGRAEGKGKGVGKGPIEKDEKDRHTTFNFCVCCHSGMIRYPIEEHQHCTRAILDTGATENAVGLDCENDLVVNGGFHVSDLPAFRFGISNRDQARGRVDLVNPSQGFILCVGWNGPTDNCVDRGWEECSVVTPGWKMFVSC